MNADLVDTFREAIHSGVVLGFCCGFIAGVALTLLVVS